MSDNVPAVRYARIERLDIYEISETELALLERGSADSLFLNFALALLSSAASFLLTLATTPIIDTRTFVALLTFCLAGFISGAVLVALWLWFRRSRAQLFADIRRRMPPEGFSMLQS